MLFMYVFVILYFYFSAFCFMHACMLLFVFVARRPHTLSQNPYGVCPSRLSWAGLGWAGLVSFTLKAFVCIAVVSFPLVLYVF